jgi:hypothetical protein
MLSKKQKFAALLHKKHIKKPLLPYVLFVPFVADFFVK